MTLRAGSRRPRALRATECSSRRRAVLRLPLAALLVQALPALASAGALDQLREFIRGTRSARGRFTQTLLRPDGEAAQVSSGHFAFARPGRFRWEVVQPYEQLLVADGERLYFFDKDLNQVTIRKLSDSLASTPAAILFGQADLERDFALRELAPGDGLDWLEAVPRNKDAGFERIALGFRAGLPVRMDVKDAFGRTTLFSFHDFVRNAAVDAAEFRFVMPKGVDVVEQ